MASKRLIGDPSKSANKRITDFWGPPARLKRQKTQDSSLDTVTEPEQTTMASSLAESSWEDKPSLTDLSLFSQEEHTWEARDPKYQPQKQQKKVDTAGLNPRKKHQQKDHSTAASTPRFHPDPEKTPSVPKTRHLVLAYQKGDLFDAPPNSVLIHACNTLGKWGGGIAATFKKYYPAAFEIYKDHCKKSTPDQLIGTALLIAPQSDRYWLVKGDEVEVDEAEGGDEVKAEEVEEDKPKGKDTTTDGDASCPEASDTKPRSHDSWIQVPRRSKAPQDGGEQRYDWTPRQSHPSHSDLPQPPRNRTHEKDIHYVACLFTSKSIGAKRDPPEMILKHTESAMKNLLFKLSDVKFNQKDCPFIPQVRMCMINSGLFGVPWERTSKLLDGIKLSRVQTWGRGDFKVIVVSKEGGQSEKKKVLGGSNVKAGRK